MSAPRTIAKVLFVVLLAVALAAYVIHRGRQQPAEGVSVEEQERTEGIAVEVERPVRMDLVDYLHCDATTDVQVRHTLRAELSETVSEVTVDVGDPVVTGQVLVKFRTADKEAELLAEQAAYQQARADYDRYVELNKKGVETAQAVEAKQSALKNAASKLQLAKSKMDFTTVRAPIGGPEGEDADSLRVEARHVQPGEYKMAGQELLSLVDLSTVQIRANVPEAEHPLASVGSAVEFRLQGDELWRKGTIVRKSPSADSPSRFFDVFIQADNVRKGGGWLIGPGMYAEVRLPRRRVESALAVRAGNIKRAGEERYVCVVRASTEPEQDPPEGTNTGNPDGSEPADPQEQKQVWRAHRVTVEPGLSEKGYVELVGGSVKDEDVIVANPRDDMPDGAKVDIIERD